MSDKKNSSSANTTLNGKFKALSFDEDGILADLFRKVIIDLGYVNNMKSLITAYKRRGGRKSSATVTRLVFDGELTWKSFVFLLFHIIHVKKAVITIKLEHESGIVSEHSTEVTYDHDSSETKKKKDEK